MDHSPYSPDLMPSGLHSFGPLKKQLSGRRVVTDVDVKQGVTSWLQTLDTEVFCAGLSLDVSVRHALNVNGDYTEVWCVPSAAHMPPTHQSRNRVLGIRMFITLFFETRSYIVS